MGFIEGSDRTQASLLPAGIDAMLLLMVLFASSTPL